MRPKDKTLKICSSNIDHYNMITLCLRTNFKYTQAKLIIELTVYRETWTWL